MLTIKIAVISDIHGNIIALEEILKDAKLKNVDKYIVSGDLVNEIPFGNDVIERLKEVNSYSIKGNKEQYLIEYEENKYNWENLQFQNIIFMYEELSKENKEYIRNLPSELSFKFENVNIKVVHGSPESITELVHKEDLDKIDKYTKILKEDLLVLGHTHQTIWECRANNKVVINAGCAGISSVNIGRAEYIIINIDNDKFDIERRLVKFNPENLKDKIAKCGILKVDKIFMNLIYLQLIGKPQIKAEFYKEAKQQMMYKNRKLYKDNVEGIYKYFKLYDDDIWIESAKKYIGDFIL